MGICFGKDLNNTKKKDVGIQVEEVKKQPMYRQKRDDIPSQLCNEITNENDDFVHI